MKAPDFWRRPPGMLSNLLLPPSWLWSFLARTRLAKPSENVGIPVICVGNLNVGGTGKTPVVIALLDQFGDRPVHVVSRGYGGSLTGPVRVDEAAHSAADVGDEPLLISAFGPVWVSKDRAAGAKAAKEAGAELIILDDGFQNPSVLKSHSIIVVDAAIGFGNGRVMPAGPLREPVSEGLKRANSIVLIGSEDDRKQFLEAQSFELPLVEAELKPLQTGMDWDGLKALAFAGIGRPEKFFDTLRRSGVDLVETRSFSDHAPYRADLLRRLLTEAKSKGAQLVTTEKDAVRLPSEFRANVLTFPVRLEIANGGSLKDLIEL